MHIRDTLDKKYRYLCDNDSSLKCGHFYLLPKIHKIKDNILTALMNGTYSLRRLQPGRPIILQCDTKTHIIGAYCDCFLIPKVKKQSNNIKDTTDFIKKKSNFKLTYADFTDQ